MDTVTWLYVGLPIFYFCSIQNKTKNVYTNLWVCRFRMEFLGHKLTKVQHVCTLCVFSSTDSAQNGLCMAEKFVGDLFITSTRNRAGVWDPNEGDYVR